mmetsp:Transcript_27249/g.38545  ORF Transcript_27249/g.38545 Transcript_27249/m.38545 type:complete len:119 (+) Transcript_27249:913-1269(+)
MGSTSYITYTCGIVLVRVVLSCGGVGSPMWCFVVWRGCGVVPTNERYFFSFCLNQSSGGELHDFSEWGSPWGGATIQFREDSYSAKTHQPITTSLGVSCGSSLILLQRLYFSFPFFGF